MNSKYIFNKKAISPLIATVLIVLVSVVLIAGIVSFSKDFTISNLDESSVVTYDKSDLDGFIKCLSVYESMSGDYSKVVLENNNFNKDLNVVAYKLISTTAENTNFINTEYTLETPLVINPNRSNQLDIICIPSKEFILELKTNDGKYISIPVSYLGASLVSCDNAPYCGDGTCNGSETEETCYDDCHINYFTSTWDTNNTSINYYMDFEMESLIEYGYSSDDDQIELPLVPNGNYDFTVDWGDGTTSEITSYDDSDKLHTYSLSGEYEININGTIEGWSFADYNFEEINGLDFCIYDNVHLSKDRLKILNISNWGPLKLDSIDSNSYGHFTGCENLTITAEDSLDILENTTYLTASFADCFSLVDIPNIENWDTSNILDLSNTFGKTQISLLFEYPEWLSELVDFSSVRKVPFNQDISSWDVSNVEKVRYTFFFSDFNQDISSWDVSNLYAAVALFEGSSFDQDIGDWNLANMDCLYGFLSDVDYNIPTSMSVENYSNTLIDWADNPNIALGVGVSNINLYHTAEADDAYNYLVNDLGWYLEDLGIVPGPPECGDESCNGDENIDTCYIDCGSCGDGICTSSDENLDTCPQDCSVCGDGFCTVYETVSSCYADCGSCGDGICSYSSENSDSCPTDCESNYFISTWDTTKTSTGSSEYNQIMLPLVSDGNYDFTVEWDDGTTSQITSWDDSDLPHTYDSYGVYDLNIFGELEGWSFNDSGDRLKISDISKWGNLDLGVTDSQFRGCSNLSVTAEDILKLNRTTSLEYMFEGCGGYLTGIPNINYWDLSNITSIKGMFTNNTDFNSYINDWNTSSITDMSGVFCRVRAFNQPLNNWDVSNVTDMSDMFNGASSFNQPLNNWDVSNVNNMYYMFCNNEVFDQNLASWNVSNVTDMGNMFSITSLSSSNYNSLLISWSKLPLQSNVSFDAGNSTPSGDGLTAKDYIINNFNWTIEDAVSGGRR
ncbi:MAG: BspA family leucine-rich repeat surface protein [Candidatus ainarchaeum sp.]|nr:BspA family leucine-rich repeat surface protein [Candidatus ainarchaeum sp.]MDD3975714.1 BspA family leucine-rich repeat surface protein [Candidatus ainarchaeum sp.]